MSCATICMNVKRGHGRDPQIPFLICASENGPSYPQPTLQSGSEQATSLTAIGLQLDLERAYYGKN